MGPYDAGIRGDIAAFVGLKDTGTGDTLASNDDPVILERMAFPVPVIDISVEPRTKEAVEKIKQTYSAGGVFKDVAVSETRVGASSNQVVFRMSATVAQP